MKSITRSIGWLGTVAALGWQAGACLAQPDAPRAPGEAAPQVAPPKKDDSLETMLRGQRDDRWRRARKDLRQDLGQAGFGDKGLQSAVVDFVEQQDLAREAVRSQAALCQAALGNQELEDADVQKLLEDYQAAASKAQADREAALAQLDAQIHFSASPRLKTLLTLKGILGSEMWLSSDTLSRGPGESLDLMLLYPQKPKPTAAR